MSLARCLLAGMLLALILAPERAWADNSCYSPNCLMSNGSHSWQCGGNGRCVESFCGCGACSPGTTACGFTCCPAGQQCLDQAHSQCGCPSGQTYCGGGQGCVDLKSNPQTCGSCGNACTAPSNATATCSNGKCGWNCNSNYTKCGNNCFNLQTDAENCGRCDNECDGAPNGAIDICTIGRCGFRCDYTATQCGNSCTDLTKDRDNCGRCNNQCSSGQSCGGGVCIGLQGCEPGSYGDGSGQCELCPAGSFSAGGSSTSCTPCPAGTYAASAGNASCTPAPPGSSVAAAGSSLPDRCPAGTFTQSPGSTSCSPCPAGTTSPPGGRACEAGIVLCTDIDFRGACELFAVDHADLAATRIGNSTASSIIVPSGMVGSLFSRTNFNNCPGPTCDPPGSKCQSFGRSNQDLRNSFIGNDNASSVWVGKSCPCTSRTAACNPGVYP